MLNKILASTLGFCIVLSLSVSCTWEGSSAETRLSVERGHLYWEPSYWREYSVDWEHGFQEGLGEVEVNGKWGFINSAGEIVIKPRFNQVIYPFTEGIAMVRSGAIFNRESAALLGLAGRCRHIDKKGRPAYKKSGFYAFGSFSEGFSRACVLGKSTGFLTREEKFGFINTKGEIVIPAKFDDVESFSEGLAAFEGPNRKRGYINAIGEVVIEPRYHVAGVFPEGLAQVGIIIGGGKSAKFGFINKRGEEVIPLPYNSARSFSEGLAAIRKGNKWGYIDNGGRLVIPFKFDDAHSFSEGYAAVIMEGKIGYIDKHGEYAIEPQFEYFDSWKNPVMSGVAPFLSSFSEGLAAVVVGIKWSYINKKGEVVIEPKFDMVGQFTEGFAKVAVGDKLGYIDKQGKYIWEPTR